MGIFTKGPRYKCTTGVKEVEPANEATGSGAVFRASDVTDLSSLFNETITTQWDLVKVNAMKFKDKAMFGTRDVSKGIDEPGDFVWKTYGEVYELMCQAASGLKHMDLVKPDQTGEMKLLGLCGLNRLEWVLAEFGCFALGGTTVPFYATYTKDQFVYALNLTELQTVVCMNTVGETLLAAKAECEQLKTLVFFDEFTGDKAKYESAGLTVYTMDDVMNAGKEHPVATGELGKECTPDTVFSFVWTSGTTGNPKGALITQKSMIANLAGFVDDLTRGKVFTVDSDDVYLSYLPIAHAMERTLLSLMLVHGGRVGFYRGDKKYILEDLASLRPTIFVSVPRLLNRIHDKLYAGMKSAGGLKTALAMRGLRMKKRYLRKGYLGHKIWDALFMKIKKRVGLDRVKFIATGSAPIAPHVLDFLRVVFACPVSEGYGQTEVTCGCSSTVDCDFSSGHVGTPSSCAEIKLVSVPEMGYLITDKSHGKEESLIECNGRGEICVRGPCTLQKYYRNPEKTAETLDSDGFVHTGDIGLWLPEGKLKIIDRKKNIFKLAQGEYVAPEKIEGIVCKNEYIAQAFAHGDSLQSKVVAVIYPDPEQLIPWAIGESLVGADTSVEDKDALAKIVKEEKTKKLILEAIKTECKGSKCLSFEIPRAVFITSEEFSAENTLLTDTFKLKRNVAREVFEEEIKAMYEELGELVAA